MGQEINSFLSDAWPVWTAIAIILAGLIFLAITFGLDSKREKKYEEKLADQNSSTRIYIIDVPKDKVTYFNVASPGNRHQSNLADFYRHFPAAEQKKVINWVNALLDGVAGASDFLETDVNDANDRKQYFSMLQAESVDPKRKILHLQSYLFKYMASSKASHSGINNHGLSTLKDYSKALEKNGRKRGATIVYRLLYRKAQQREREIDPVVFTQVKNVLFPFAEKGNFLIACSGNELILGDAKANERPKAAFLVKEGLAAVNRFLLVNALSTRIECRCGAVENYRFPADCETLVSQARKMAEIAFDENQSLVWYEKGKENRSVLDDSSYRTEVERIINEKRIAYAFRPIYSVKDEASIGYFAKADPKDTYFDSMEELKDYASRTGDDRELFTTVARNLIPLFVNERLSPKEKLFFPVRVEEKAFLLSVFPRIAKAKDANLVLLFDENDIRSHTDPSDLSTASDDIVTIKAKGFEVALLLGEAGLNLPSNVYSVFDYFVCGFGNSGSGAEMDTRIRARLHSLVEKLLKFNKPIIANDVQGWGPIEILVRSGLSYISSQDFSPYDAMILPLPPKSVRRVSDMKK